MELISILTHVYVLLSLRQGGQDGGVNDREGRHHGLNQQESCAVASLSGNNGNDFVGT
jgi:hypothetical protein